MKYSKGFAWFGINVKKTFPLYSLSVIFNTIFIFIFHFFSLISEVDSNDAKHVYFLFVGYDNYNSEKYFKMLLSQIPIMVFILTLYVDIQVFKAKNKIRKNNFQINIVTFNQNSYFYILFLFSNIILILIRINVSKFNSCEKATPILVFSYLIYIFIDWLIRPIIILIILRKKNTDFFEDSDMHNGKQLFYMKGLSIIPRQQKFMDLKPFCQNARWGSSKKFSILLANTKNPSQRYFNKQMPEVSQ